MDKFLELIRKQEELIKELEREHDKKRFEYITSDNLRSEKLFRQAVVEDAIKENEEHTKICEIKHPFLESFKNYIQSKDISFRTTLVMRTIGLSAMIFAIAMKFSNSIVGSLIAGVCIGPLWYSIPPLFDVVSLKIEQKRYNSDELKKEHEELTNELEQLETKIAELTSEIKAEEVELQKLSDEIKQAKEVLKNLKDKRSQALSSLEVETALNQEFDNDPEITATLSRRKVGQDHE